jgi:hypothetical protein
MLWIVGMAILLTAIVELRRGGGFVCFVCFSILFTWITARKHVLLALNING